MRKSKATLLDEGYNTPQTSLLTFHFDPQTNNERIKNSSVQHTSIEGKDIYIFDGLFSESETEEMRAFSKKTSFSRHSYGSAESIERGERPARSMNGKERWEFFSKPPMAVQEIYKFLGWLAHRMDAEVSTLPWELCDKTSGSPSVIANFLEEASPASMDLGKHQDCNPEKKVPFGIPLLYGDKDAVHPTQFINGSQGRPWLISIMLYCTAEDFSPEYCMGTAFYKNDGELSLRVDCLPMRLVLFEGDIFHSIEESKIPTGIQTWRVSYVYKLLINPKRKDQCLKRIFYDIYQNGGEL